MKSPQELFKENENLVLYTIKKMGLQKRSDLDFDTIVSYANEGLWNACNNFDENVGKFSTIAVTCIKRNIYKYFRNIKRHKNTISIERELKENDREIPYNLADFICDDNNVCEHNSERYEIIEEILASLVATSNERNQGIFISYMLGNKQADISKMYGIGQAEISRLITKTANKIRDVLSLIDEGYKFPSIYKYSTSKEYREAFSKYYSDKYNKGRKYLENGLVSKFENIVLGE